jgi:hypothetical protein
LLEADFDGFADTHRILLNCDLKGLSWEMGGLTVRSSAVVTNPGANWKVVGTGDFNGDSHADILLQNITGRVGIWEMSGSHLTSSGVVSPMPGPVGMRSERTGVPTSCSRTRAAKPRSGM